MNVLHPKQTVEQALGAVDAQRILKAAARSAVEAALASAPVAVGAAEHGDGDDARHRHGGRLRTTGLVVAGALAGVTAASAAISSARRRSDGDHDSR